MLQLTFYILGLWGSRDSGKALSVESDMLQSELYQYHQTQSWSDHNWWGKDPRTVNCNTCVCLVSELWVSIELLLFLNSKTFRNLNVFFSEYSLRSFCFLRKSLMYPTLAWLWIYESPAFVSQVLGLQNETLGFVYSRKTLYHLGCTSAYSTELIFVYCPFLFSLWIFHGAI